MKEANNVYKYITDNGCGLSEFQRVALGEVERLLTHLRTEAWMSVAMGKVDSIVR